MGYVEKVLRPDEQVIARGRMHWIIYLRGAMIFIIGLACFFAPVGQAGFVIGIFGAGVVLLGLYLLASALIEQLTTEVAVTTRRVIQKRGLIRRNTGEMNMDKVESVVVDQTILGRLLNYGTIGVRGSGSGIENLHHIADPLGLRSAIVVR